MADLVALTPSWSGRRVLVTGATGLVGSWLVKELLTRDAHVVALVLDDDPRSEFHRSGAVTRVTTVLGAVNDVRGLERAVTTHETDTVFHLAAQALVGTGQRAPFATLESNVRGTYNLLEVCRAHRDVVRRIVVASSDKAYGPQAILPYTEDLPLGGGQMYGVSKAAADAIARAYFHNYSMAGVVARCGNVYGGGDLNWSRLVPGTIRSLLMGERPVVRSDGTYVRDYVYVADVARAYVRLAECAHEPGVAAEAFNVSSESPVSVLTLVGLIQRLVGRTDLEPDVRNEAAGEIPSQYLSAARARARLGWKPEFDLETGLRETIAWYRSLVS